MIIVLFGCQQIAKDIIDFIIDEGSHQLVQVIEQDEERDYIFGDLVREHCLKRSIPTIRFNNKIDADFIRKLNPDIIFSIYYRKIIPQAVLDIPRLGCVNIHPAELPKYRGPNPTYFSVLNGDKTAGTTLHYIDKGMDTGDIIAQKISSVDDRTGFELNKHMMSVGVELFKENYHDIMNGTNKRTPQDNSKASCIIPFRNNFRYINWMNTPETIINHMRAHAPPYAGSISQTNDGTEVMFESAVGLNSNRNSRGPGYFEVMGDKILVQTFTTPLCINKWKVLSGELKASGRFISGVP